MPLREFSSVKVGDQLPEKIYPLTRQDLVNYAGVSGDLNPIHWDDEIAKVVGLDTAIAHGMLTMGLGGGYVTSWVGDPGRGDRVQRAVHCGGAGAQRRQGRRDRLHRPGEVARSGQQVGDDRASRRPPAARRSSAGPSHRRSWRNGGDQYRHPRDGRGSTPTATRWAGRRCANSPRRSRPTTRPVWMKTAAAELGYDALVAPPTFVTIFGKLVQADFMRKVDTGYDTHADRPGRPALRLPQADPCRRRAACPDGSPLRPRAVRRRHRCHQEHLHQRRTARSCWRPTPR